MDTEGWISIAMIASFNRIRSLTPEVPIIKEMMEHSSLLEVQGDHVRLVGEDAKKWVLPDAKLSPFPPATPAESAITADDATSISGVAATPDTLALESVSQAESISVSGLPDDLDLGHEFGGVVDYKRQPGDLENALMKSASGITTGNTTNTNTDTSVAPSSTAASVLNGDENTTTGTSVVDEDKA